MEAESWSRIAAPSRRHQTALPSRFDLYVGLDKVDGGEEDPRVEFPCPFCAEEFDMVGLCCHIDDEHPVATTKGVCPICEDRVGMDMLGHIMMLHGNYFKMSDEGCLLSKPLDVKVAERAEPSLPDKNLEEKTRRSGFVQELVLSTLFKDIL